MSKTAVVDAVRHLDLERVRRLVRDHPTLLATTDRDGRGLLHLACSAPPGPGRFARARQVRLADWLLDQGLAIDEPAGPDRCTPLFFAVARARNAALVRRLIKRGARPAAAPGGALFAAGWWEDLDTLDQLVRAGAEVDVVVGVTPFLACWCWKRFRAARRLAWHGANVNHQDQHGRTALHHGVRRQFDPAHLAWLVRDGASADITDGQGVSARMLAARKRDKAFAAALA